jgi:biopolymer transport protein ExbB/TolQ
MSGKTMRCAGCDSKLQIPDFGPPAGVPAPTDIGNAWDSEKGHETQDSDSPATAQTATAQRPHRSGWEESDPTNANPWLAIIIGSVSTAAWYAIVHGIGRGRIYELFALRGWVNYSETWIFFWALGILYLKWEKLRKQKRAFYVDVLPQDISHEINRETVGGFIDYLYSFPARIRDSLIINRMRKALELFEVRQSNAEIGSMMSAQSDIDSARIAGSYTLVKLFLWAIPILGFVGTVIGLSQALGALDIKDPTDPNAIKAAMTAVTNGMGTSFDTTLLGLVLAMFLNFPIAALSKAEDDNLTDVDAFCNEELLPRLNDKQSGDLAGAMGGGDMGAFVQALATAMADAQNEFLKDLRSLTQRTEEQAQNLDKRADAHASRVANEFSKTMIDLRENLSSSVSDSVAKTTDYVRTLASALQGLNGVLKDLGEKQILIQQVKKKSWFQR